VSASPICAARVCEASSTSCVIRENLTPGILQSNSDIVSLLRHSSYGTGRTGGKGEQHKRLFVDVPKRRTRMIEAVHHITARAIEARVALLARSNAEGIRRRSTNRRIRPISEWQAHLTDWSEPTLAVSKYPSNEILPWDPDTLIMIIEVELKEH